MRFEFLLDLGDVFRQRRNFFGQFPHTVIEYLEPYGAFNIWKHRDNKVYQAV
jgi:hypothetical protein